jgi:23S rRNA (guanosine2251-2'-O)-methyltransferase
MMSARKHSKGLISKINGSFWIYGKHAVRAALLNEKREVLRLVLSVGNRDLLRDLARECGGLRRLPLAEIVDKNYFSATFGRDATHQGCAVLVRELPFCSPEDLIKDPSDNRPFVFLDQVVDPQNVGGILRAAAVFGARAVVVPDHGSPALGPTIWKVASGAVEVVPLIRVTNLFHSVNDLKKHGFWSVGLDERADRKIDEISLDGKFILIIGGEGSGMRRLTKESCDFMVKLPSSGSLATLNAAQAATVALYEVKRQTDKS